jgi:cytidylate kinase
VRLVAGEKYRVQQLAQRNALAETAARRLMLKLDRDRREFVSRYFHHDSSDPHLYDLVLNVERLGPAAVVEQIVAALCR